MKQVQINTAVAACQECLLVVADLDTAADAGKDEGARVQRLEVSPRHLQHQREGGGHNADQTGATLDVAAPLVTAGGFI